jgi:hypothetical protein
MQAQVQMQMQWQSQAHQQQYTMLMQQQAMHAAQMQMHTQFAMQHTMTMQRQLIPPQHLVHFQQVISQHTQAPQANHLTAQQTLMCNVRRTCSGPGNGPGNGPGGPGGPGFGPVGPGNGPGNGPGKGPVVRGPVNIGPVRGPGIVAIHPVGRARNGFDPVAVHQAQVMRQPRFQQPQQAVARLAPQPQPQPAPTIVHVAQRRIDVQQPGRQLTIQRPQTTVTAQARVNLTMQQAPPVTHQQQLTRTDITHRPSVRMRITTTMTCGTCHVTAQQQPTLVLTPPARAPQIIAVNPPILPELVLLPAQMPEVILPAPDKEAVKKPKKQAVPARKPGVEVAQKPARNPELGITPPKKETATSSLSRTPALPPLREITSSPSMRSTEQLSSLLPARTPAMPHSQAEILGPPQLPTLSGEIMQVILSRPAQEAVKIARVPLEDTVTPQEIHTHPALPALTPAGPSVPVEVAIAKSRTPSLAEIVSQAPALPALRP